VSPTSAAAAVAVAQVGLSLLVAAYGLTVVALLTYLVLR